MWLLLFFLSGYKLDLHLECEGFEIFVQRQYYARSEI